MLRLIYILHVLKRRGLAMDSDKMKIDNKESENTLARKIVATLIWRSRRAQRRLREVSNRTYTSQEIKEKMTMAASATWAEAHNAAECARRVLYDHEL